MKRIKYDIKEFDIIEKRLLAEREEQIQKSETELEENQSNILEFKKEDETENIRHKLTDEEIQIAEEFRSSERELNKGKKKRGIRKIDMISGAVYTSKLTDVMSDSVTLNTIKQIREELDSIHHVASTYTDKLTEAAAPELLKNKELYKTFIDACGAMTREDIDNIDFNTAVEIFEPYESYFEFGEMLKLIRNTAVEVNPIDNIPGVPVDAKTNNINTEAANEYKDRIIDVVTQYKATIITQVGVDTTVAIITNYLSSLLTLLNKNPKDIRTENIDDEINKIILYINAAREHIAVYLKNDRIELSIDELEDEIKYIDSLEFDFNNINDLTDIHNYIDRSSTKLKLDFRKKEDMQKKVIKLTGGIINSSRRYPVPSIVETSKELFEVLNEFISSTMIAYDFGEFFIDNAILIEDEEGIEIIDIEKYDSNELQRLISLYDNKKEMSMHKEIYTDHTINMITESKAIIWKLYTINQKDIRNPDEGFNKFLERLMPNKFEYFQTKSLQILYIIMKLYSRGGKINKETEYNFILLMEVISKLNYGENARRLSLVLKKLDEKGL